jgi:hypothetical protein
MLSTFDDLRTQRDRVRNPEGVFYFGLDLGKAADHSALCIIQKTVFPNPNYTGPPPRGWAPQPNNIAKLRDDLFHIAALERYPLQTFYRDVRADVNRRVGNLKETGANVVLGIDMTGVGGSEVESYQFDNPHEASISPIYITGGATAHTDRGVNYVPKNELITTTNTWMQTRKLRTSTRLDQLQAAKDFKRELGSFQGKQKLSTGNVTLEAWREAEHDDLVLAVCMAVWLAKKDVGAEPFIISNFVN